MAKNNFFVPCPHCGIPMAVPKKYRRMGEDFLELSTEKSSSAFYSMLFVCPKCKKKVYAIYSKTGL